MHKVLLIEDDPILQDMYKHKFTHEGFEIQVASDGRDGIDLMKKFQPDIVLLDLILPQMTGFSVLDVINNDPEVNSIPVIVMTNIYADGADLVKNHGVKAFLMKSNVSPDEVVRKAARIIAESQQQ